jgi:hypothetical protein
MPLDKITVDSISANAVTNVGIANGTIVSVDLADQAVIGSKLGLGAVSGNNITENSIRGNNIVAGTITGNLIASQAITGDDLAPNSIRANNIVAGSISSNTLSSNLTLSLSRVLEEANINSIAVGGNVNIDISNNSVFFFNANTTANVTFNIRGNNSTTFDNIASIGATSIAIAVKHGTVRHEANLSIDGVQQTLYYAGNTKPSNVSISSSEINLFNYSIFKTASNSYVVITSNTLFALG